MTEWLTVDWTKNQFGLGTKTCLPPNRFLVQSTPSLSYLWRNTGYEIRALLEGSLLWVTEVDLRWFTLHQNWTVCETVWRFFWSVKPPSSQRPNRVKGYFNAISFWRIQPPYSLIWKLPFPPVSHRFLLQPPGFLFYSKSPLIVRKDWGKLLSRIPKSGPKLPLRGNFSY